MAVIDDIATFKAENGCDRLVMVWCGSTEAYQEPSEVHVSVGRVRAGPEGQRRQHLAAQIYAYAALQSGRAVRQRRPEPLGRPARA